MSGFVRCYAEGRDGSWEAFCLDWDIAVQGISFDEVRAKLRDAMSLYLETIRDYPEKDRRRLLSRRMPLKERLKFQWKYHLSAFANREHSGKMVAGFTTDCHA